MDDEDLVWFISHPTLHLLHHSSPFLTHDLQNPSCSQLSSILKKKLNTVINIYTVNTRNVDPSKLPTLTWAAQQWKLNTVSSRKKDGIWNHYNLKSSIRIYTFQVLKCSGKFESFRLTVVHFNMCTVCSSGDVQTKFCLLPCPLNHASCYSFNGSCDPFLQVLDIPYLLSIHNVIFMQDGAPPHFSCFVTDVLNERFPDVWIGRGGPIPWPPRSPDLSPHLSFSCGGTLRTLCMLRR